MWLDMKGLSDRNSLGQKKACLLMLSLSIAAFLPPGYGPRPLWNEDLNFMTSCCKGRLRGGEKTFFALWLALGEESPFL